MDVKYVKIYQTSWDSWMFIESSRIHPPKKQRLLLGIDPYPYILGNIYIYIYYPEVQEGLGWPT